MPDGAAGGPSLGNGSTGDASVGSGVAADTLGVNGPGAESSGGNVGPVTKLPIPRYVSLRSGEINVRRGPGLNYRMDWVFRRAGLPVKIINEFGDWRQILDSDNATGWVYHALVTGRRTVLITDKLVDLHAGPEADRAVRARAEQGVVADLRRCERDWCEIEADGHAGWVPKTVIWGVDPGEIYPR